MSPKVSVIVTTYNRCELLSETIQSIINQTFTDFELIVVDNNSNYDFVGLMQSFCDSRIKFFQNPNDGIIARNRNFGIKRAVGEYIALCDDDDIWEQTKLREQVEIIDKYPDVALCCTNTYFINMKNLPFLNRFTSFVKNIFLSSNLLSAKYLLISLHYVINSSVLFKRELINSCGFINEDPLLRSIEDYEFWFRISQNNRIYYLNKKLLWYRLHPEQLSTVDNQKVYKRTLKVVSDNWRDLNLLQKIIYSIQKRIYSI
ncbi:glycosyltransferase [Daejeonella sp. H1SJ63]|uniref:glycosyltransferase family 2 protein n=1 Tax=Daejeonella sp. H1SJ63 TaxID=3034145 RepID=UPI0023ECA8D8|nr:glycosyltransferase [Daejeonella sp. H1SJ63]